MHYDTPNPLTLRFTTFLSPVLYELYASITNYIGEKVGYPTNLTTGYSLDEFRLGNAHIGFMCGLLYTRMAHRPHCPIELLAAPVLQSHRYGGNPIYFSDVIVRKERPIVSFNDLHGCVWGYNEQASHSGWNLVCHSLSACGRTPPFFGSMRKTGSHQRSIEMIIQGEIDAAAIDSHVLDVLLLHNPSTATQLRIVETLGPSAIPPIVVSKSLNERLTSDIQHVLFNMHRDPCAANILRQGLIDRFVPVHDTHYEQMYEMFTQVQMQNEEHALAIFP
jgi:phosphonate transport system substrate-binding protein